MTREEFVKNLQYQIWSKAFRRTFPFVTKVELSDDFEKDYYEYDSLYNVTSTINYSKLIEMYPEFKFYPWIEEIFNTEKKIENSLFYDLFSGVDADNLRDEMMNWSREFNAKFQDSDAVPNEHKINRIPFLNRFDIVA